MNVVVAKRLLLRVVVATQFGRRASGARTVLCTTDTSLLLLCFGVYALHRDNGVHNLRFRRRSQTRVKVYNIIIVRTHARAYTAPVIRRSLA